MSLYGCIVESNSIIRKTDDFYNENAQSLSEAEAIQFQKDLLEVMIDLNESNDFSLDESVASLEEGANMNMTAALKSHLKSIKDNIRSAKKKSKSKDFSGAKSDLSKAKSELKTMESEIKKEKSTIGSAVIGWFATGLVNIAELFCPLAISLVGSTVMTTSASKAVEDGINIAGAAFMGASEQDINNMASKMVKNGARAGLAGVVTFINNIVIYVKEIIMVVKTIKQFIKDLDNKESTEDALNLYRNKLLQICSDLEKKIDKVSKLIEKRAQIG